MPDKERATALERWIGGITAFILLGLLGVSVLYDREYLREQVSKLGEPSVQEREPDRDSTVPVTGVPYEDWKRRDTIGPAAYSYEGDLEVRNLRSILERAFVRRADREDYMLDDAEITTLLLYYRSYQKGKSIRRLVKFQHVVGKNDANPPILFYTAEATTQDGSPTFVMFSRDNRGMVTYPSYAPSQQPQPYAQWARMRGKGKANCLIVGYYPLIPGEAGDDFWVDVPKYSRKETDVVIDVRAEEDFASTNNAESMWEVDRRPISGQERSAPISFYRIQMRLGEDQATEANTHIKVFHEWLGWLDDYYQAHLPNGTKPTASDSSDVAIRVLQDIHNDLQTSIESHPASFLELLTKVRWRSRRVYKADKVTRPVVLVLNWDSRADN